MIVYIVGGGVDPHRRRDLLGQSEDLLWQEERLTGRHVENAKMRNAKCENTKIL